MKILLVTSQITYVPNNCQDFFDTLMKKNSEHIAGVVMLQNFSPNIVLKALGLFLLGCSSFAATLLRNILKLPIQEREKLLNKYKIPVFKLMNINERFIIDWVRKNNIDLIINLRTRCIYKKEILHAPTLGCINIHHGILPKDRGVFCDLYALHEKRPAGISMHVMNEQIDAGDILYTKIISNKEDTNYVTYLSRTGREEASLISELLNYVEKYHALPHGRINNIKDYVITKTPSISKIKEIQRGGMIL